MVLGACIICYHSGRFRTFPWLLCLILGICCRYSTAFTSVHGGRPSAEYAKLRKESLESEFGHALGTYSSKRASIYRFGPFLALYRAAIISFHVLNLTFWQLFVHDIKKRAIKVQYALVLAHTFSYMLLLTWLKVLDWHWRKC